MASQGLRVLALAQGHVQQEGAEAYQDLTLLGMVGLLDPPREEVEGSIQACRQAGVRVVMVTGDQPATAKQISEAVGLVEGGDLEVAHGSELADPRGLPEQAVQGIMATDVFARVTPKQKLALIATYQEQGEIVAMTGDGVNDAPALKKADIGVAMGQRGTQVAREAADMILKDDAFTSIVAAVEHGRAIFNNIRKFVIYLLSCNVSEIMVVSLASLGSTPLPIRPLQILYLNLITDVFPALALGVGEGDPAIMRRPPREPTEPILRRGHWIAIGGYAATMTAAVLGSFLSALFWLDMGAQRAVTVSFLTLAFVQIWHVFNMRGEDSGMLNNEIVANPYVWGALLLCTGLLLSAAYLPWLSDLLGTVDPGLTGWALILGFSLIPLALGQVLKQLGVDGI
jgi:Ca2+-transporting ATPase